MDKQKNVKSNATPLKSTERKQTPKSAVKSTQTKSKTHIKTERTDNEPRASTSGISKAGGPITLSHSSDSSYEYVPETKEEDKSCICHTY